MGYRAYFQTNLSANTVQAAWFKFAGNGPWDPDLINVGFYPYSWTTWSTKYAKYWCPAAKISIKITPQDGNFVGRFILTAQNNEVIGDQANTAADYWNCKKVIRYCNWKNSTPKNNWCKLNLYATSKQVFKYDDHPLNTFTAYTRATTAAYGLPAQLWVFSLFFDNNNATNPALVDAYIKVKYYIKFFQESYNVISEEGSGHADTPFMTTTGGDSGLTGSAPSFGWSGMDDNQWESGTVIPPS